MNKKGQVTIFVIVGILLVAGVVLFFALFKTGQIDILGDQEFNPESFVDKCIRDSSREKIDIMVSQGGFINPTDYKVYNDINVAYLCKNVNYYEPCINQYPLYISRLQEELEQETREDVESCFLILEDELKKRNYGFEGGDFSIDVILKPERVELIVYRDMKLTKNGVPREINSFSSVIKSPLYDLGFVANEIVRQEAKYCYFEYVGFMLLYNDFDIKKYVMSDSTKIYTILHKSSGEEMNIAVRGCAIPPGF